MEIYFFSFKILKMRVKFKIYLEVMEGNVWGKRKREGEGEKEEGEVEVVV